MANHIIRQYVYSGENIHTLQNDTNILADENNAVRVKALSIQAPPGTKFCINRSTEKIIVGVTGLFEIPFSNIYIISSLTIAEESINAIQKNPSSILIVDTIQEGDGLQSSDANILNTTSEYVGRQFTEVRR